MHSSRVQQPPNFNKEACRDRSRLIILSEFVADREAYPCGEWSIHLGEASSSSLASDQERRRSERPSSRASNVPRS
eukprot:753843-Hanusia_phi.AAC.3